MREQEERSGRKTRSKEDQATALHAFEKDSERWVIILFPRLFQKWREFNFKIVVKTSATIKELSTIV